MPFADFVAYQGFVDERMRRVTIPLERLGWRFRFVLFHPGQGWVVNSREGLHIFTPTRIVSNPLVDELLLMPLYILLRYLPVFVKQKSRMNILFVNNLPDVFSLPILLLGKVFRVPTCYDIRDPWKELVFTESDEHARVRFRFALYFGLMSMIEKMTVALASGIFYANESLQDLRSSRDRAKPTCIINNYSRFSYSENANQKAHQLRERLKLNDFFVVSYVGARFPLHRGIDILLEGFSVATRANPKIMLLMVGAEGASYRWAQDKVKELKMEGNCLLVGWVPSEEFPEYYLASDVTIVPHRRTLAGEYTAPNKLFDSLVMGRPVIITRLREHSRYFQDEECGIYVQPDDAASIADAVLRLSRDPELVRTMSRRALEVGENYKFSTIESAFSRFVSKLAREI